MSWFYLALSLIGAGLTYNVAEGWYMDEAVARGWVVISPAAPQNVLWFQGAEQYMEEFLDSTLAWLKPEDGLFHIGGVSNGGRSTFRILGMQPDRFASVTVYPGYPSEADTAALELVPDIPFTLWVGGDDAPWIAPMEALRDHLTALGRQVSYSVFPGAPHVIPDLTDGVEIFANWQPTSGLRLALSGTLQDVDDPRSADPVLNHPDWFGHVSVSWLLMLSASA